MKKCAMFVFHLHSVRMCVQRSSKSASTSSYVSLNSSRGGSVTLANSGSGSLTNSGSAAGAVANSSSANGAMGGSSVDCSPLSASSLCEICCLMLPQNVCHSVQYNNTMQRKLQYSSYRLAKAFACKIWTAVSYKFPLHLHISLVRWVNVKLRVKKRKRKGKCKVHLYYTTIAAYAASAVLS